MVGKAQGGAFRRRYIWSVCFRNNHVLSARAVRLTCVNTLQLNNCEMTALPSAEAFMHLSTVCKLGIVNCRELAALDGIEKLTYLRELTVNGCDKLDEHLGMLSQQKFQDSDLSQCTPVCSSQFRKLEKLRISSPFLLQWEPLRGVNSVNHLTIDNSRRYLLEEWLMQNRSHLKGLGVLNATQLELLPSIMAKLDSLETLELCRVVLLTCLLRASTNP
ncbi:hypothetical protein BAE44_0005750 [Dichanthelium oligosanthes]|uniref:Uncharacterized protein n=1 Tax=Dichanthelium oligosanthes TaxID=888268 RepID=A0A1E5W782_9POAL|nr:hypothetical protein BAE44_0005750 [Dichanthelium oligosanthes]